MMKMDEFKPGELFFTPLGQHLCLDKGHNCVIAIKREAKITIRKLPNGEKQVVVTGWSEVAKEPTLYEPTVIWDYEFCTCYPVGPNQELESN